jgi:hypothetical protein
LSDASCDGIRDGVEIGGGGGGGGEDGGELGGEERGTATTNEEKSGMAVEEIVITKGRQFS